MVESNQSPINAANNSAGKNSVPAAASSTPKSNNSSLSGSAHSSQRNKEKTKAGRDLEATHDKLGVETDQEFRSQFVNRK